MPQCIAFSPNGTRLVSGSKDGTTRLWEAATAQELATIEEGHASGSVAFSPDGKTLAIGSNDGAVKLWDISTIREGSRPLDP